MAEKSLTPRTPSRFTDPFQALRAEMDRMFESVFGERGALWPTGLGAALPSLPAADGWVVPSVDITETDKEMTLTAELPGLEEKDVELSLRDGVLTLKGEKKLEHEEEKSEFHLLERRYGSFQRSFRLPDTVDAAKIDAKFDKGVLTVTMPKKAEAKAAARKIAISGR
jgi:HSP20 family protein